MNKYASTHRPVLCTHFSLKLIADLPALHLYVLFRPVFMDCFFRGTIKLKSVENAQKAVMALNKRELAGRIIVLSNAAL